MSFSTSEIRGIYETYAPLVFRRAFQFVRQENDAWDVVHDVFEVLLKDGRRFRAESSPMSYIFGITTHLSLRVLRRRRYLSQTQAAVTQMGEEPALSGSEGVDARELIVRLRESLGENERPLEVAVYKYLDGMTQEQIAKTMGLSRKTIQRDLEVVEQAAIRLDGREVKA